MPPDTVTGETELLESGREPAPVRRRWPWLLLAGLVVLGLAVPSASRSLAHVQTERLAEVWASRDAYYSDRSGVILDLRHRLVAGEEKLLADTVVAMELEQSRRLRRLADGIRRDAWQTFSDDVQSTEDLVRRALVTEARALETEATRVRSATDLADAIGPIPATVRDAATALDRLRERHDVAAPTPRHATFAAVDRLLHQLSAPIAARVPLRLVVVAEASVEVVDLYDGHATSVGLGDETIAGGLVAVLPPTTAAPAGEVAVQTFAGTEFVPLDGGKARRASAGLSGGGLVLPRAGGGGWLVDGVDVSTLTAGADPVPIRQLPLTATAVNIPQPANGLVISHDISTWLWEPATGHEVKLGDIPGPRPVAASATKLVSLSPLEVVVVDARTGSSRHVRLWHPPSAYSSEVNNLVSPDGGALAMTRAMQFEQVWYVDLATGQVRLVMDGTALGWSPDGRWLAVLTPALDHYPTAGKPHSEVVRLWSPDGAVVTVARLTVRTTADPQGRLGALVP